MSAPQKSGYWLLDIKQAQKRCESMGAYHAWTPAFDKHALAATMDNYTACIDVEMRSSYPRDYQCVLYWIWTMAQQINAYCDTEKVAGNPAAEYWLERFLWRCECFCKWGYLSAPQKSPSE